MDQGEMIKYQKFKKEFEQNSIDIAYTDEILQ